MGVLLALTVGLVLWIVGWTFGVYGLDPFLPLLAILVGAAAGHVLSPYLTRRRL